MFDSVINKSNITILYAEDEPDVRRSYTEFFKDYFNNVIVAENGDEAWEKYLINKPSIVVLDILMPGLNGVEVAEKIREHDKETVIIIMTANDTIEWYKKSIELNLRKFIKKGGIRLVAFEQIIDEIIKEIESKTLPEVWKISQDGETPVIEWNLISQKMYKDGVEVILSKKLIQIINYFYHNSGRIISYDEIAKELWTEEELEKNKKTPTDQKIRAFLNTLKVKLGGVDIFRTHYKQGYSIK